MARLAAVAGLAVAPALVPTPAALAQEPIDAPAVPVNREAYYTAPSSTALPPTVVREFPPGVVCLLAPPFCGEATKSLTGPLGLNTGLPVPALPEQALPQPVEPGSLPVALFGGVPRYTSTLRFDLPDIPAGSLVSRFDLVLSEGDLSYALESPAFRAAVLAAVVQVEERDPAKLTEALAEAARSTDPLRTNKPTGVEACLLTATWAPGPSQAADVQPARDCIFGATGVRDLDTRTWTFDLSSIVQAWVDGTYPNEGSYLGPLAAENLAVGDPDFSTNFIVSLRGAESADDQRPRFRAAFEPGLLDMGPLDLAPLTGVGPIGGGPVASVDAFSPAPAPRPAAPRPATGTGTGGEVIQPGLVGRSQPRTPWYVWLLVPLGLAGLVLFERAAESTPSAEAVRAGALTRLVDLRRARAPGGSP